MFGKPKWHLITRVTEEGLIKLVNDVNEVHRRCEDFANPEFHIRADKEFGPYQVNILTKDWDYMISQKTASDFASQYRED